MEKESFDFNNEEYVNSQIDSINSMLSKSNYAMLTGLSVNLQGTRPRRITRDQIRRALDNPFENVNLLQQTSTMLKSTNGIYQEVLDYQSNMLTNDYMLIPVNLGSIKTEKKMAKALEEQALFLSKYNIKYNSPWIYKRVLEQGELYAYKMDSDNGIILLEIPANFCKVTKKENSLHRFAVDLSRFKDDTIIYMPKEIQQAYKRFKDANKTNKDIIDRSYYQVSENGIAFVLEDNASKCLPYYSSVFDDFIELEDKKDLKNKNDILSAIKLIHQKLPINKDNGQVQMNTLQATTIHNATKASLPKNTAIVTHPLEMEILNLSDSNSKLNESIDQATGNIYASAGISAELFNGKKNSDEAIASGIVVDSLITFRLQKMVANWINYELSNNKKQGALFKISFIDSTYFNKDAKVKSAREDMAYGGSRTEFLATKGYEPNEGLNLLKMENLLGLDSIMIPQKSAHTMSSSDTGRPTKTSGDNGVSAAAEEE